MSTRRGPQLRRPNTSGLAASTSSYASNLGIDVPLAVNTLIIAFVGAVVAAVLDVVIGLPTEVLRLTLGWLVAALAGATYSFYTRGYRTPAIIMAAVNGMVAMLVYFVVYELIGDEFGLTWQMNVFKALVTGFVLGLVGFGWFYILRRIPAQRH